MGTRSTGTAAAVAIATFFASGAARAAPIVFDGEVPAGGPDHFFLDFTVPTGTQEIEIRHDDLSEANILDFGLEGPDGYRGWGGGTTEPIIVNEQAASRAYVPGPVASPLGSLPWRVVVGKAKVVASPARYHVEVHLRTTPTLAPVPRRPYAPVTARKTETRYYAGDFHVHSRESTDASATLEENIRLAKSRGLDFIEISDHNTITQLDFFGEAQDSEPAFLLLPGIEFTTYAGHANLIGATKWVDHKIGQPDVTIERAVYASRAQGASFSINHPAIDVGDLCIGCAWKHEVDPSWVQAVEIATLGLSQGGSLYSAQAIAFWDKLLERGGKIAPIGGSDDHRAGTATGFLPAKVGSPTTLVRAKELSVAGILEGVRKGATVVKLDGPDDPMVELEAAPRPTEDPLAFAGDTIDVRSIVLRARVTGGTGAAQIRFVKNGVPLDPVVVTADPFVYEIVAAAPAQGEERWRAEALVDEKLRTVTSHIWLRFDPSGPEVPSDDGGCSIARDRSAPLTFVVVGVLGLIGRWRRGRRQGTT